MQNKIKEIKENWGLYMQYIDEKPAITRTNLAFFEFSPIGDYSIRIQFAVYYKNQTESGLPIADENPILWKIEDSIAEAFANLDIIDVGLMKWNNRINFFVYAKDDLEHLERIKKILMETINHNFADYKYEIWFDQDENWDCYIDTLYPNKYSMQEINNNRVLDALQNSNDNLDAVREIEHWAYFSSKKMADKFIQKIKENNFTVFSNTIVDDNYDCNFQVGISRKDSLDDIHQITWLLLDLAEELDGYYDGWECGIVE